VVVPSTGAVRLIDFGLATRLPRENPSLRTPNVLEGTLAYISPEQTGRMNRSIDYRSDLYSLGVVLYELLLGRLPFPSQDATELVHCHIAQRPPSPKELSSIIPRPVSDMVMKLLAKTAEERYQSAAGVASDLGTCLACCRRAATGQVTLALEEFTPGCTTCPIASRYPRSSTAASWRWSACSAPSSGWRAGGPS
jgi:serine/threonine protein kinase